MLLGLFKRQRQLSSLLVKQFAQFPTIQFQMRFFSGEEKPTNGDKPKKEGKPKMDPAQIAKFKAEAKARSEAKAKAAADA